MKKISPIFITLTFTIFILSGCTFNDTNNNYKKIESNSNSNTQNITNENQTQNYFSAKTSYVQTTETDIATFSTPILDKTENRQNNLRITCSKINNITVEKGSTFSFCQTVGKSTTEEGYKKATILVKGKQEQALGGGNCQVSTTLYNAVLSSPGLTVTEHHDHGKKVPYIEEGKDATISYGLLDLQFRNDSTNAIKIYASTDDNTVTVRIVKIENK